MKSTTEHRTNSELLVNKRPRKESSRSTWVFFFMSGGNVFGIEKGEHVLAGSFTL